jgi:hypothetical protein
MAYAGAGWQPCCDIMGEGAIAAIILSVIALVLIVIDGGSSRRIIINV